jgi:hypothetical protein
MELPIRTNCNTEHESPMAVCRRTENDEPKVANCSTLIATPAPRSAREPDTLQDEPTRTQLLRLRLLPTQQKVSVESAEPRRAIDRIDIDEPMLTFWITLSLFTEDRHAAPKMLIVLPTFTMHRTESVEPQFMNWHTLIAELMRT